MGLGNRMDLVFLNIRIGLFHNDHTITTANIAKAKQMLEEGGDWDRRNRLKVRIENVWSSVCKPSLTTRCTRGCMQCQ